MEEFNIKCNIVKNNNLNNTNRLVVGGKNYKDPVNFFQDQLKQNNRGINLDFVAKQKKETFNFQNSFSQKQIPLWERDAEKKVSKKSLFSYIVSLSFVIFALSFVNNQTGNSTNFVNAESQSDIDFNLGIKDQIFVKNKNIGIGTENPNYKMEIAGAMFLEDSEKPISSPNHSGIYSNKGELYVLDASGNSTKISAHDKKGLWQYSSNNSETGKNIEIEMESLTKELNKILGGGYITENGKIIDQGENALKKLTLQINENVGTLEELKSSVDNNLKIINKEINKYDKKIDNILEDISDLEKDKQTDSIKSLQDKVNVIALENESLLNFFLAINPKTLIYTDKDGNINLDGFIVAKEISVKNINTEKISIISTDSTQSVGKATILKGEISVFVKNNSTDTNDKIFITPNTPIKQTIATTEIKSGEGFAVSIAEPLDKDLTFDWFIINEINHKKEIEKPKESPVIIPPNPNEIP